MTLEIAPPETSTIVVVEQQSQKIEVQLARGLKGDPGPGLPTGGTTGQVVAKKSDTEFDTEWVDLDIASDPLAYYILAKS